ncbi:MAG: hypothetical protein H7256_12135 [Bdellovibrio sp.]|nr:hypothetical protein [Bdellovibrio sp.]
MKQIMISIVMLFSILTHAAGDNGYVKKVVEDDEGAKVVLSKTLTDTKAEDVKTVYMSNTQPNFEETKQALLNSKNTNTRVNLSKDAAKTLTVRQLGQ